MGTVVISSVIICVNVGSTGAWAELGKNSFMVPEQGELDNNLLSYRQPMMDRSRILSGLWIVL